VLAPRNSHCYAKALLRVVRTIVSGRASRSAPESTQARRGIPVRSAPARPPGVSGTATTAPRHSEYVPYGDSSTAQNQVCTRGSFSRPLAEEPASKSPGHVSTASSVMPDHDEVTPTVARLRRLLGDDAGVIDLSESPSEDPSSQEDRRVAHVDVDVVVVVDAGRRSGDDLHRLIGDIAAISQRAGRRLPDATTATAEAHAAAEPEVARASDGTHDPSGLTRRELEVLRLLVSGTSNRAIAQQLAVSDKTVRNYVSSLYRKLGIESRGQLIRNATAHRHDPTAVPVVTTDR